MGEIHTQAAVQGRAITLDPLLENADLTVTPVRVENTMPCGFRSEWLDGENDEWSFDVCSGIGTPYLILSVQSKTDPTDVRDEFIDLRPMVSAWIAQVIATGKTPVWSNEKQAFVPAEDGESDAVG